MIVAAWVVALSSASMTLSLNSSMYFGRYLSLQTQVLVSQVVALAAELELRKVVWKSLMKVEKFPKEEASRAFWVWTASQLLVVPLVMKERV